MQVVVEYNNCQRRKENMPWGITRFWNMKHIALIFVHIFIVHKFMSIYLAVNDDKTCSTEKQTPKIVCFFA